MRVCVGGASVGSAPSLFALVLELIGAGDELTGLARELAPRGITVNTVQPGPVETDINPDSGSSPTPCGR